MLKGQDRACRGVRHIQFEGCSICNVAFMKLFGLGKSRFHTLSSAARKQEDYCPYDARYVEKGPQLPSETRMKVHEFLMQLYLESAEHIPDGVNSNKRPRQGSKKLDRKGMDRSKIKHLPHGSINDYYVQFLSLNPGLRVSRKLFSSEP